MVSTTSEALRRTIMKPRRRICVRTTGFHPIQISRSFISQTEKISGRRSETHMARSKRGRHAEGCLDARSMLEPPPLFWGLASPHAAVTTSVNLLRIFETSYHTGPHTPTGIRVFRQTSNGFTIIRTSTRIIVFFFAKSHGQVFWRTLNQESSRETIMWLL